VATATLGDDLLVGELGAHVGTIGEAVNADNRQRDVVADISVQAASTRFVADAVKDVMTAASKPRTP
jgi:hypothetical protein